MKLTSQRSGEATEDTNPQESAGRIDWRIMRLLSLIGFSPRLHDLVTKTSTDSTTAANVHAHIEMGDKGFGFFYHQTTHDAARLVPTDRAEQAYYLSHNSARLRLLAKILSDAGSFAFNTRPPRFLVFCAWPVTL